MSGTFGDVELESEVILEDNITLNRIMAEPQGTARQLHPLEILGCHLQVLRALCAYLSGGSSQPCSDVALCASGEKDARKIFPGIQKFRETFAKVGCRSAKV